MNIRKFSLRWMALALFICMAILTAPMPARAQAGFYIVVTACGTPPTTLTVGKAYQPTMDVQGRVCGATTTFDISNTQISFAAGSLGTNGGPYYNFQGGGPTAVAAPIILGYSNNSAYGFPSAQTAGAGGAAVAEAHRNAGCNLFDWSATTGPNRVWFWVFNTNSLPATGNYTWGTGAGQYLMAPIAQPYSNISVDFGIKPPVMFGGALVAASSTPPPTFTSDPSVTTILIRCR